MRPAVALLIERRSVSGRSSQRKPTVPFSTPYARRSAMFRSSWKCVMQQVFSNTVRRARSRSEKPRRPTRPMLELLETRLAPATVTINTDQLTISGDGDNSDHAFYGTAFTASFVNGVAQFRFAS